MKIATEKQTEKVARDALKAAYEQLKPLRGMDFSTTDADEELALKSVLMAFKTILEVQRAATKEYGYVHLDEAHIVASALCFDDYSDLDEVSPYCIAAIPTLLFTKAVQMNEAYSIIETCLDDVGTVLCGPHSKELLKIIESSPEK